MTMYLQSAHVTGDKDSNRQMHEPNYRHFQLCTLQLVKLVDTAGWKSFGTVVLDTYRSGTSQILWKTLHLSKTEDEEHLPNVIGVTMDEKQSAGIRKCDKFSLIVVNYLLREAFPKCSGDNDACYATSNSQADPWLGTQTLRST